MMINNPYLTISIADLRFCNRIVGLNVSELYKQRQ